MAFEDQSMAELTEARRQAVQESIHSITTAELKSLGEGLFPYVDHPWRERFFSFLAENEGAAFYHAVTHDNVHILYCAPKEIGMWFLAGSGMGPLQPKGVQILKEIVQTVR